MIKQTGIFSRRKLNACYRYLDIFQVLPVSESKEGLQVDFPLILEVNYSPEIWRFGDELFWRRDVWEKDRLNKIQNKSGKAFDIEDKWWQAYAQRTKSLRWMAIRDEIPCLLTLFTKYDFFTYPYQVQQAWFIDLDEGPGAHRWGQQGYNFEINSNSDEDLSDISKCEQARMLPIEDYKKKHRNELVAGRDNSVTFPEDLTNLLGMYFQLDEKDKKAFFTACKLYNQALELNSTHSSLSLVACATAIEALIDHKVERVEGCQHPVSLETCDVCGIPLYQLSRKFRDFFVRHGAEHMKKFANNFYNYRSLVAHGGLLRADQFDSGFYSGDNDEEEGFRRTALDITNHLLISWLVSNNEAKHS